MSQSLLFIFFLIVRARFYYFASPVACFNLAR
jgi:hypothetical protein